MLHYKLLPAFHFSWEELPRSEDSCIRWNKQRTEICLRSIETMHWALMSCAMQCVTGGGGAIAGAVKLSNGPNFTSTSRMPMRIIWEPLWILAYYQIAIKLAEWLPDIRIHKQIGCHWSLSPLPLDWIGCLQSSANIFKIQQRLLEDQLTAVDQALLRPYGEPCSSTFLNIFGYSCWLILTLPDSMDASHFTESSVLLSCFFKQPSSQSRANGTDSTVIITQIKPTYIELYNHERNDSIVFSKAQIMFQLHKVISHCWC